MPTDNTAVIRELYDAFARGDIPVVAARLQNTEWHEAEGLPYGGVYHGADAIFQQVLGPVGADVEGFSARPDEYLPAGEDRVLAIGRYAGKGPAGPLDAAFAHLWTVRDGAVVKFVQYADTHKYRQALGG